MANWTETEVEFIVTDYFDMLVKELAGQTYNKSLHRRNLMPLLDNRSSGSIEQKHRNISAVLQEHDIPFIRGYQPLDHYQHLIVDVVINHINNSEALQYLVNGYALKKPLLSGSSLNFENIIAQKSSDSNGHIVKNPKTIRTPLKVNYLEKERKNQDLGQLGEEIVLNYERWYLTHNGAQHLANQVTWDSKDIGDGLGYDILSRNLDGTKKFIEVKTTKLGMNTPFFFTENELNFSSDESERFYLYRVFNASSDPKIIIKKGSLSDLNSIVPVVYKGLI